MLLKQGPKPFNWRQVGGRARPLIERNEVKVTAVIAEESLSVAGSVGTVAIVLPDERLISKELSDISQHDRKDVSGVLHAVHVAVVKYRFGAAVSGEG